MIPKPDDLYPRAQNDPGALFIVYTLPCLVMATTIQFNSEANIMAIEIQNIAPNRVLSPKLKTTQPAGPQNLPQQIFCICLFFTKLPGKNKHFSWYRQDLPSPCPLPQGEGNSPTTFSIPLKFYIRSCAGPE